VVSATNQSRAAMTRRTGLSLLALTLALAGCGSASGNRSTTLRLEATQTSLTRILQSKQQRSTNDGGDAFITSSDIAGGGLVQAYCVISERPHTDWCAVTVVLPRGQLSAQGVFLDAPRLSGVIALLSGSGAYEGATGTLASNGLSDRSESITIRLG
jgi:hypothetical protein